MKEKFMSALLRGKLLYIFRGTHYICYDIDTRKQEPFGERNIEELFNIPISIIDGALDYDNDIIFFFRGMDCFKYEANEQNIISGYPKKIIFEWKGIWASDISDVMRINDKIFFFRKTQYIRYDISLKKADNGYPKSISEDWNGIWESIDGAVYLKQGKALFFKNNQVIQYDLENDKSDEGYPMELEDYIKQYQYNFGIDQSNEKQNYHKTDDTQSSFDINVSSTENDSEVELWTRYPPWL
jgi:hypothetical protein